MEQYKLTKLYDANGDLKARWFAYYSYINPDTYKFERHLEYISTRLKTKTARYRKYDELKKHIDKKLLDGWNPYQEELPELISINNALEIYFKRLQKTSDRSRTIQTYSSFITRITEWCKKEKINNLPVAQFSYHYAQKFMDYLLTNRDIGNRTYNNYISTYRIIFNTFEKRELILKNPFNKIEFLEEIQGKIVAFTDEEWKIIYENLPEEDPQLWVIANFIYYAALRPAEIMRLKFSNVDLPRAKIYSLAVNSKNKKQQVIEIPDTFLAILKKMDWNYPSHYYIFSRKLLPGLKENAPTRIAERWRKFADNNNIKERTIYDFKHNAAGRLCDAGFDLRDIQLHFRHHSLDQTEEYLSKFRNIASARLKHEYPPFI